MYLDRAMMRRIRFDDSTGFPFEFATKLEPEFVKCGNHNIGLPRKDRVDVYHACVEAVKVCCELSREVAAQDAEIDEMIEIERRQERWYEERGYDPADEYRYLNDPFRAL